MTNKEAIICSIRFIEENLREDIRVSDVAREAGYSLFHFIRLFSALTGFTPKEYILQRKLSEAAKVITSSDRRILDIAFDFEFQTHEAFTRAFHRYFGENPADFRKYGKPGHTALLEPITLLADKKTPDMDSYERVTLNVTHLVGFTVFIENDTRAISRMWDTFGKHVHTVNGRKECDRFFQLSYWTEDPAQNGFFCMAGVETNDLSDIPPSMCGKTIPRTEYLRFIHRGLAGNVGATYEKIYGEIIPHTDFRLTLPYNVEIYDSRCLGPDNPDSESEIYIPVEAARVAHG